jgi:hypothetical protein
VTSVVVFTLVCYGIAFLVADASILGCGTAAYNEDPDDAEYIWSKGIFKLRPYFLQVRFFRELFTCYFCLGVWVGPVAHVLLYYAIGERYWFYHTNTQQQWLLGCILASMTSATGCYFMDSLLEKLNSSTGPGTPEMVTYDEEFDRGDSENDH